MERVALALAFKGLEVQSVEISYEDRLPVVEVSGQGLVPVLVDGDEVVPDSVRILRRLEATRPDPPLFSERDRGGARARRARPRADRAARRRESLDLFEAMLDGRDHLFGDDFSAADCAAFPFLKYGRLRDPADDELLHLILEEHLRLGAEHPRLAAWIDRVNERARA